MSSETVEVVHSLFSVCTLSRVSEEAAILWTLVNWSPYAYVLAAALYSLFWLDHYTGVATVGAVATGLLSFTVQQLHLVEWGHRLVCELGVEFPDTAVVLAWFYVAYYGRSYLAYAEWSPLVFLLRSSMLAGYGLLVFSGVAITRFGGEITGAFSAIAGGLIGGCYLSVLVRITSRETVSRVAKTE